MSTTTCDNERGWHSGISSCVRLAAMMPAMRAAPRASPFLASPLRIASRVLAAMTTRPSAIARRSVTALLPTSTMRASPRRPRCVSSPFPTMSPGADRVARQQRARRGGHVGLPHQALADQEGRDPGRCQALEIGRTENSAFTDDHTLARDERGEPLADGERRLERLQVPVVDADQRRGEAQRPVELGLVVYFE